MKREIVFNDREWLARLYEKAHEAAAGGESTPRDDESKEPGLISEQLAERAQAHFQTLLVEYSVEETAVEAFEAGKAGVDSTILVQNGLKRALERAARDTAAALRRGDI